MSEFGVWARNHTPRPKDDDKTFRGRRRPNAKGVDLYSTRANCCKTCGMAKAELTGACFCE